MRKPPTSYCRRLCSQLSLFEASTNVRVVQAFVGLQLAGGFGFAFIILSALLSRAKKHTTWFSFCTTWIVFSFSFSLLSLAGQQASEPKRGLCIAQSALIYAGPPLYVFRCHYRFS